MDLKYQIISTFIFNFFENCIVGNTENYIIFNSLECQCIHDFFFHLKKNESLHTHPKNSRKPGKYETIRVGWILAKVTKCCKMWFDKKFFNLGTLFVKTRNSLSLKKFREINSLVTFTIKRLLFHESFVKKVWELIFVISTLCLANVQLNY